ncbi:cupin domain-containing protein [Methanoculleus sp. Wushi-C6]|uniref:Cupin domain-containing protein n=1 Tax=Methanoculleus caldifontis TaxID=2651577 RepID=A0ABU3X237_9EURY|nr:cupin domain-containing protein [Methanoculleus sp. Wushi-C6]MDV2482133.1 cupin domain-containing protein [Methanoculleus sp. Wushi-C6]
MYRIVSLLFVCILLSAGCLAADDSPAGAGVSLLAPVDPIPIFDGQATYSGIIGNETPQIRANYSMGHVAVAPGNATPPHRLLGTAELVYVLDGTAEIRCDNETVTAREGETVLLPEGVLQSIASAGDTDLHYITVSQPAYTPEIEISGDELDLISVKTDCAPFVVPDPRKGIEWNATSDAVVYTLLNPVLMSDLALPINYSLAYGELQPGGYLGYDGIAGSSDLIYVIEGELEVVTPDGAAVRVPAGSAAYVPPDLVKTSRNAAETVTKILSFVDPAWTEEKTGLWK